MYSVWNQGLGAYDYFESSAQQASLNAEKPGHLVSRTLGSTIDQAAWPLPGNVRHVGSGENAVGRVATRKSLAMGADAETSSSPLVKAGMLAAAAFLIWKYVVKAPRRRTA
jgi:hypothetical protein